MNPEDRMNAYVRTWVSELLDSLERLSQLTQANTAAVNHLATLLAERRSAPDSEAALLAGGNLSADLARQLELAAEVMKRLAELQASARSAQPSSPEEGV
jgi:hypothetical protein